MTASSQPEAQVIQELKAEWFERYIALKGLTGMFSGRGITSRAFLIFSFLDRIEEFGYHTYSFFLTISLPNSQVLLAPAKAANHNHKQFLVESIPTIILDQITKDIGIFCNAYQQRVVEDLTTKTSQPTVISETLALADHLAWSAKLMLNDYIDSEEEARVLSLLDARAQVRLVPYMPLAVIGVPMTAVRYFFPGDIFGHSAFVKEFLGIPHEFAHYVYWYGRVPDDTRDLLRERLQTNRGTSAILQHDVAKEIREKVDNWVEEIFADVVGCLLGGPAVALSLQEMMAGGDIKDFYIANGTYPINTVRPFVLTQTLRHIGMEQIAQDLQDRWKENLIRWKKDIPELIEMDLDNKDPLHWGFPVYEKDKKVGLIYLETLDNVLNQILELVTPKFLDDNPRWTSGKGTGNSVVERLYGEFNDYIKKYYFEPSDTDSSIAEKSPRVKPLPDAMDPDFTQSTLSFGRTIERILSTKSQQDLQKAAKAISQLDWPQILDDVLNGKSPHTSIPLEISADIWNELLTFGGWTTEGPGSPRVGG